LSDKFVQDVLNKYRRKLGENIVFDSFENFPDDKFSREYDIFRKEALEHKISKYEDWCNKSEKIINLKVSEVDKIKLQEGIDRIHLHMSVEGAMSFAVIVGFCLMFLGIFLGVLIYIFNPTVVVGGVTKPNIPVFMPLAFIIGGLLIIKPLSKYPLRLANLWRLKASNQMVLCILYVVMYMRHTSNLEHAIKFAGEHIGVPLSLDLRKVLWDVEVGKFVTIRESLDFYLLTWKDWNLEFVESFHLIEGSLFEGEEKRRLKLLDKALDIMLNGTYEGMMHYAQDLKSPVTMLHMLGVILPILGLVIFPLMGSFLNGLIKWYHLSIMYNVFLPLIVLLVGMNLMIKRPSGYGETDILKSHPELIKEQKLNFLGIPISAKFLAFIIGGFFVFVGFIPLIIHFVNPSYDTTIFGLPFLDYKCEGNVCHGPYSLFSLLFSLLIPLGISLGFALYYKWTTVNLIKIKNKVNLLEREFAGALFQLGNRVGDGVPVELAFSKVASNLQGTPTGQFFSLVDSNIRKGGMNVKEAIFDKARGAIGLFPSRLIESSMKVLVQSARKSPIVVSTSLMTISDYVHKIHQVDERLKDLLSEIISSMKSQVSFLTPMIAGIVVAVASMVVSLVNKLGTEFVQFETGDLGAGLGGLDALGDLLKIQDVIPGFHFQLVVGIYVVQLVFILTILAVDIEKGVDKITERYYTYLNLLVSIGVYSVVSFIGIVIFNLLVASISLK